MMNDHDPTQFKFLKEDEMMKEKDIKKENGNMNEHYKNQFLEIEPSKLKDYVKVLEDEKRRAHEENEALAEAEEAGDPEYASLR